MTALNSAGLFDPWGQDTLRLLAQLHSGEQDLQAIIDQTCDRLDTLDPQLQAFLPEPARRARLHQAAQALLIQYPDPAQRPPLFGLLIGVKDIFRVRGFQTRAGSTLPPDLFDGPEASVITALKGHSALVLGKTVTTEFAYFAPGPTRNPHNLEHTPGGSSSGSAAAVAAGLCPVALGTQTIGSVIRPAAYCGIVGFKPSFGRIPTGGVIPISHSLDHVGLLGRDVETVTLIASLVCGNWRPEQVNQQRFPTLGIPDGPYLAQATPEALTAFEMQIVRLEAVGYPIKRTTLFTDISTISEHNRHLMSGEMAQVHADWFAGYESRYAPQTANFIRQGQSVTQDQLEAARRAQADLRQVVQNKMQELGIELWACPAATGPAPHGLDSTGNSAMALPWTFSGLPAVSIPAGATPEGLPLGLQLVAPFEADEWLLGWAAGVAKHL